MRYDAFISYSHASSGRLSHEVALELQRLRPGRRVGHRIFRDASSPMFNQYVYKAWTSYRLRTRAEWRALVDAMDESRWLVLIASVEAAHSMPVNREIAYWLEHRPIDRVAVAFDDSVIRVGALPSGLSPSVLPTALRARGAELRTVVPVRAAFQTQGERRRFRRSVRPLAEAIFGVDRPEAEVGATAPRA